MNSKTICLFALSLLAILLCHHVVMGQNQGGFGRSDSSHASTRSMDIGRGAVGIGMTLQNSPTPELKIRQAVAKLKAAQTTDETQGAKVELLSGLETYFDADMKQREAEIVKVEQRIEKLRAQLEKRRAAKKQIIDLQMQVLENESQGLGFYNSSKHPQGSWNQVFGETTSLQPNGNRPIELFEPQDQTQNQSFAFPGATDQPTDWKDPRAILPAERSVLQPSQPPAGNTRRQTFQDHPPH